jgi:hypothetical protein
VLGRELVAESGEDAFCAPIIDERTRLVLIVGMVGLVLVAAGFARGRSHLFDRSQMSGRVSVVTRVGLAVLGLLSLVFAFPLWVVYAYFIDSMDRAGADFFRAILPVGIALAALTVAALASLLGRRGHRLTLDHSMAAVSLAVPLLVLILIDRDGLGVTDPGLIDPNWTSSVERYALCGVPVSVSLLALANRQNRERSIPPAGMSGLALIASATALTLAMVPDTQGGDTDQSFGRFALWLVIAVATPWVTFAGWEWAESVASASLDDVQSDLA